MKQEIPWNRLVVEAFVIVGSILLAFGIDAWWDERQERAEEGIALKALLEEFETNLPFFKSVHEFHVQAAEDTSELLDLLLAAPPDSLVKALDSQLVSLIATITRETATGTLNTLLASGKIDLIQNQELQQALAGWSSILEGPADDEIRIRSFVIEQLIPGLTDKVDLSRIMASRSSAGILTDRAFSLSGETYDISVNPVTLTLIGERHLLSQTILFSSRIRTEVAERIIGLIELQLEN